MTGDVSDRVEEPGHGRAAAGSAGDSRPDGRLELGFMGAEPHAPAARALGLSVSTTDRRSLGWGARDTHPPVLRRID